MNFIAQTCVSGSEVQAALIPYLPFIGKRIQFIGTTLLRSETVVCMATCKNAVRSNSGECGLIKEVNVGYFIYKSLNSCSLSDQVFSGRIPDNIEYCAG